MKRLILTWGLITLSVSGFAQGAVTVEALVGAWQSGPDEKRIVWINTNHHFSAALYNVKENAFLGTCGGSWKLEKDYWVGLFEFCTMDTSLVGKTERGLVRLTGSTMFYNSGHEDETWTRIDDGRPGRLAGAWLITGREREGKIQESTPGVRRTMKILSGTRFQWIAYNIQTREFFGTGGGTYTTEDGKYTEQIEFFSRDPTRVGASLTFDFSVADGHWMHKGLSSKGEPIHERWTLREKLKM
jgi:hypothetical protein